MISKIHAVQTMNAEFGNVVYAIPDTYYVGLSTTEVDFETGTGFTEPDAAGYSRKAIANDSTKWAVTEDGIIVNAATIEFDSFTATISNTELMYWFISSSATGGTALYYDRICDPNGNPINIAITAGGRVIVPAGNLRLSRAN